MPVEPVATVEQQDVGPLVIRALDGEEFNTTYVQSKGKKGNYSIRAHLQTMGNYTLTNDTATYNVLQYTGRISVQRKSYTCRYVGQEIDMLAEDVLGVSETEGFAVVCEYSTDKSHWEEGHLLNTAGKYYVRYRYKDKTEANYKYYQTDKYDDVYEIQIDKGHTALTLVDNSMSVMYDAKLYEDDNKELRKALWAMLNHNYFLTNESDMEVECTWEELSFKYRNTSADEWSDEPYHGANKTIEVQIAFLGNTNYEATTLDTAASLTIEKCIVRISVEYDNEIAYGSLFKFSYEVNSAQFHEWKEGQVVKYDELFWRQKQDGEWEDYFYDGKTNPLPGVYQLQVKMDSELYVGRSSEIIITVDHLALPDSQVELGQAEFEYGKEYGIDWTISPVVKGVELDEGSSWSVRFGQNGSWNADISQCGRYDVEITLNNDALYEGKFVFVEAMTITPKEVVLSVWDIYTEYGEDVFANGYTHGAEQDDKMVGWKQGAVLSADVGDFLKSLKLYVVVGDARVLSTDRLPVQKGGYAMQVECTSSNYTMKVGALGRLYVDARTLTAGVIGDLELYEGSAVQPDVSLEHLVDWADEDTRDAMKACFYLQYYEDDTLLDAAPSSAGRYKVVPAYHDSELLANYKVNAKSSTLVILSLNLPTSTEDFAVSGRFESNETLSVVKGLIGRYTNVVSNRWGDYHAVAVYEIANPPESKAQISFRLLLPEGCRDPKMLCLVDDQWMEVSFVEQNGYAVFTQRSMSTTYIICSKGQINWLLIGLIVGGALVVIVVVVVLLVVNKVRRTKRLAADAAKSVAAPTAGPRPNEDEELDSLIETFDESTVERELTPAERIALRQKEEKYQQYRARLQRMRTSDRTLNDTMSALGLHGDEDDDAIIARMIEADEERARQMEEETRQEEMARREQEAAPTAVILEKREEVLEQRTFAPTQNDSDDDEDIDI